MLKAHFFLMLASGCLASPLLYADNVDLALEPFHETCLAHGADFERTAATQKTRLDTVVR
ncbi:hypothetical protein X757_06595 [Mesorhizobium sp. LSHC414A00]|nr:hypothetical protein X757_06595 [Mesorhizobium sp. LSHC414A00]